MRLQAPGCRLRTEARRPKPGARSPKPPFIDPFLGRLEAAIRGATGGPLIRPRGGVLVGVSGGADSMALLHALAALAPRPRNRWRLAVAHLHHGLRGADADRDRDLVAAAARALGLPLAERRVDVAALRAARGRGSIQEIGRAERYRFFAEAARARGLATVAIAHHRDDQVETVVQRILRGGSGLRGIAGIPRRRAIDARPSTLGTGRPAVEVVRPFLDFGRDEVRGWLAERGIPFHEDRTNADPAYQRNRVRHEHLPALRGVTPDADARLLALARAVGAAAEVLERGARAALPGGAGPSGPARRPGRGPVLRIPVAALRAAPEAVRTLAALRAVERAAGVRIGRRHAEAIVALGLADGSGGSVDLPGGLVARRQHAELMVERLTAAVNLRPSRPRRGPGFTAAVSPRAPEAVSLRLPGRTRAPAFGLAIAARVRVRGRRDAWAPPRDPAVAWLDRAALPPGPVVLRRPRPGDRLHPVGVAGRKKVQDLFVDAKVPRAERARAAVLEAGGEVVWLVGQRLDRRFLAGPGTREVMEIRVGPEGP